MRRLRFGLVGTRFEGLDGVTLESVKVAHVLESLGHEVVWLGGVLAPEFSPGVEVPEAFFDTGPNLEINRQVFGSEACDDTVLADIEEAASAIKHRLAAFVEELGVDVLVPQNALAIPMQLPLGVAIARYARESGMPTIAHHHDFAWERSRFWPNAVGAYLAEAFPPTSPNIGHLVINSIAGAELSKRTGATGRLLPNIMDFANPPEPGDGAVFRRAAALTDHDRVILQPTRMVPRKGIEDTLELAQRLDDPTIRVVVTHPEPDEGAGYIDELVSTADRLGVDFRVVPVGPGTDVPLADAYAAADLVAYPSRVEGFGNALLEAFYFRRPLLVNRYPVFVAEIGPHGVKAIEMDVSITVEVVAWTRQWLVDP
ncbi:MAG: glycosyltransferase, partial [Acidimicrobiia bacterium]|nr:glycosyltransferase [Acidimicrobiia bacterium]MDX2467402.1 glycosyltransferase [Acidimicrobiia bacterium]